MADLFQGNALPALITTEQKQVTAPDFYTNYLQDITNLGQNAMNQSGVAGLSPLQQQAFQMAPQASFAGAESMGAGSTLLGQAGSTIAPNVINDYMNPYTNKVVNEMGRLQGQNIQRNVMPALNAAGAASGNFGSSRMANATGQTMADMQANLTGQQYGALSSGYKDATSAAQEDLRRTMQSGQALGNLGTQQNQLAVAGMNELTSLGGLQQAQGQKLLDQPMINAQNFSKLMQPYAPYIPSGSTIQTTAPGKQDQYTLSPLQQITGLGALFQSLFPDSTMTPAQQAQLAQMQAQTDLYNQQIAALQATPAITPAQQAAIDAQNAQASYYDAQTAALTAPKTTTAADLVNQSTYAKSIGLTANPNGTYTNPTTKKIVDWQGNAIVAGGGLVSNYYNGGSVSDTVMNDAAGGDPYAYANGGYVYDQNGNMIG